MLRTIRREPSAILLAAQLGAVLLYPFMETSDVGRALLSVFGIAILALVLLAVRSTPAATEQARELGARTLLSPREGPAGWRSVVASPAGGEIALWQQKR